MAESSVESALSQIGTLTLEDVENDIKSTEQRLARLRVLKRALVDSGARTNRSPRKQSASKPGKGRDKTPAADNAATLATN